MTALKNEINSQTHTIPKNCQSKENDLKNQYLLIFLYNIAKTTILHGDPNKTKTILDRIYYSVSKTILKTKANKVHDRGQRKIPRQTVKKVEGILAL